MTLEERLERELEELRDATAASRVTLRLDRPGETFPVVAEALAPGVNSIRGATEIDLRAAKTYKYLERELRPLVQNDCRIGDYAAPRELVRNYGVKAQMLAPLVRGGKLAGIVSVHYVPAVRRWSPSDRTALADAVARIEAVLADG